MAFCPSCGARLSGEKENKLYDVILVDAGKSKMKIIKDLRTITGMSLSDSVRLVDSGSYRIKCGVSYEEAFAIVEEFEGYGAEVDLVESGEKYEKPKAQSVGGTAARSYTMEKDGVRAKHRRVAILELITRSVLALSPIFALFLPLFTAYGGAGYSMFDYSVSVIKNTRLDDIDVSNIPSLIFSLIPIILFACMISLLVRALISAVKSANKVFKFDEYYETKILNAKPENVAEFLKNKKALLSAGKIFAEIFSDVIIFRMITAYSSVSVPIAVVVLVPIIIGFILENITKAVRNKAYS